MRRSTRKWNFRLKFGLLLTLCVVLAMAVVVEAGPAELVQRSHYSEALGMQKKVAIFYPEGYTTQKAYPVLYLLHVA